MGKTTLGEMPRINRSKTPKRESMCKLVRYGANKDSFLFQLSLSTHCLTRECQKPKNDRARRNENIPKRDAPRDSFDKTSEEARKAYEDRFGKPEFDCPIYTGSHFVYHCPLKTKLIGGSGEGGTLESEEAALCIGKDKLLVINVVIRGSQYSAIVDTGATASYLPSRGKVVQEVRPKMEKVNVISRLAKDKWQDVNDHQVELMIGVRKLGETYAVEGKVLLMKDQDTILGHDILIG